MWYLGVLKSLLYRTNWRNVVKETKPSLIGARSSEFGVRNSAFRIPRFAFRVYLCLLLFVLLAGVAGAQPVNDLFTNAITISNLSGTITGTNNGATLEACEPPVIGLTNVDNSVWYVWTAPNSGSVEFDTIGSKFDTVLEVYTTTNGLCDPNLAQIAADDNFTNALGVLQTNSQVRFQVVAGATYYVSVNGNSNAAPFDAGSFVLNWTTPPANDNFTNAITLAGYSGAVSGTNTGATMEANELTRLISGGVTNFLDNSVWYAWTAPTNGVATFNTLGSAFDTVLSVFTASNGLASATRIAANASFTNSLLVVQTNSQVSFAVAAGKTYYISVSGNAGAAPFDAGRFVLNWNLGTIPSGTFSFTLPIYVVSDSDSTGPNNPPDGNTVDPSLLGARITVVRPPGAASGRVFVDYALGTSTYTNVLTTNVYGANVFVTVVDTNGNTSTYNTFSTNTVYNNLIQSAPNGAYVYATDIGAYTNYLVNSNGSITISSGTVTNVPTNFPVNNSTNSVTVTNTSIGAIYNLTNFYIATNVYFTTNISFVTNRLASQTNYSSVTNFVTTTNYTTTTPFLFLSPPNGVSTNGFNITNETDIANIFIVTNGPLGTNIVITSILNAGLSSPAFTNTSGTVGYTNYVSSTSNTVTVLFSYQIGPTNQIVPASGGITTSTAGTLVFNDYQMSADILVPVVSALGPDVGYNYPGISSYAPIYLSNPRLDTNESSDLEPPTIATSVVWLSALGDTYNPYQTKPTIFNIERSTFRVNKNTGTATVSVTRAGGIACDSVAVDYRTSPNNTFTLQAGSDYATPGSDFTSVSGTLSWGSGDTSVKTISIPIQNNGLVEFNEDILIQLSNPRTTASCANVTPLPTAYLGLVNQANLTIPFNVGCGQEPAGAVDTCWNVEGSAGSVPPFLNYPGTQGSAGGSVSGNGGTVYATAEQPDGKLIIAGSFISFDSNPYNRIARLLNNGYQDTSFLASPNSGANDFIAALALQPDGKILIGGNFTAFNGVNRYHIARLNSDGSVDSTFNPGVGANGMVWSIALQANGQAVIGGSFSSVNGTNVNAVARLNADGSLDPSFNPGVGPDGTVNAVVVDATGRVIIGGDFSTVSSSLYGGLARLNVDGSLDTSFNPGIGTYNPDTGFTDPVNALALQPDGRLLAGGSFSYVDLNSYNGLARFNIDGTVDTSFHPGTGTYNPVTHATDNVKVVQLQPDGTVLIGGDFTTFSLTRRVGLARLYPDGTVDTSFMDTAYNQYAGLINYYHNPNAVNAALYPQGNHRNFIDAIAQEWATNVVTTINLVTNNGVVTTNVVTTTSVTGGNILVGGNFLRVGGGATREDPTRAATSPGSSAMPPPDPATSSSPTTITPWTKMPARSM